MLVPPRAFTAAACFLAMLFSSLPVSEAGEWMVRRPTGRALRAADFDALGIRVVREFRHIPWAVVEGAEESVEARLQKMLDQGEISAFEPVMKRYLASGATAQAAFPWVALVPLLGLMACGGDDDDPGTPQGPAQRVAWGVEKIRAVEAHQASTGKGIKVVVIDTGIDTEHPDLKVSGGVNLAFDAGPQAEWDDCVGHGTHVAGIIAAKNNKIGVVGVAPDVDLYAARVFACSQEFTTTAWIVGAMDWSIENGMQVANLSLGAAAGSFAEQEAMARAEEAGIVIVAASGNESAISVNYPAAYETVVAVGATDEKDGVAGFSNQGVNLEVVAPGVGIFSSVIVGSALVGTLARGSDRFEVSPMEFSGQGRMEAKLYSCGLAFAPSDCPDAVKGNIALIARGQNFFSEKVSNATVAGAIGAVIYNHTEDGGGLFNGTLGQEGSWIPTVSTSNADGLKLVALGDGASVVLDVTSSDYTSFSGTSMASPHVAGLAALVLAVDSGLTPSQVRQRIVGGVVDLGSSGRDAVYGFGRIDAAASLGLGQGAKTGEGRISSGVAVQRAMEEKSPL